MYVAGPNSGHIYTYPTPLESVKATYIDERFEFTSDLSFFKGSTSYYRDLLA